MELIVEEARTSLPIGDKKFFFQLSNFLRILSGMSTKSRDLVVVLRIGNLSPKVGRLYEPKDFLGIHDEIISANFREDYFRFRIVNGLT